MTYDDVKAELAALRDEKYAEFSRGIANTELPVLGVRTPALRALAKKIKREYPAFADDFFSRSGYSFEEVMLCGWQLGKDCGENVRLLTRLIPRFASWAHTDQIITGFGWVKDPEAFLSAFSYLKSGGEYETRAYVMMLFELCVNEKYLHIAVRELPTVPLGRYYVDMAAAWLICEIAVKFYDVGVSLLRDGRFTPWVVNKAISKCRDSYRLTAEQKAELKTLKR